MICEEAIVYMLANDDGVKAITTRIYPEIIPQNPTCPLITYQRVSGFRDSVLSGPSGFAHPRMQVDAYAETYAGAKELAGAIRGALNGKTYSEDGIKVASIVMVTDRDLYEDGIKCYRVSADYMIWHTE